MRKIAFSISFLFVVLTINAGLASAQTVAKALAFAQMVAGGSSPEVWETIVNLDNRGTTTYTGSFNLFTTAADGVTPQPWNPIVNGNANAVTNGQMNIAISAGDTITLTLTGSATTVSGFGIITPISSSDSDETSFLEGTLTYYVLSGGKVSNSIGVQPSSPIYLTSVPFDNFSTIAFALANTNPAMVSVQLTLFSASNQVLGTQTVMIQTDGHVAEYLWQLFSNFSATSSFSGRLDIQCDSPIFGVALTDVNNQFSSLPFLPAVKEYNWATTSFPVGGGTITGTGTLSMRVNGALVEIQSTQLTKNGQPVQKSSSFAVGAFVNGVLNVSAVDTNNGQIEYYAASPFSLSMPMVVGSGLAFSITSQSYLGSENITLTATN